MLKNFSACAALTLLLAAASALTGCPAKPDGASGDSGKAPASSSSMPPATSTADANGNTAGEAAETTNTSAAAGDKGTAATPVASASPSLTDLEAGKPAPDFAFSTLDGKKMKLSDLRGKPVVLNFWATWCIPCKAEFPDFQKAYSAAPGKFELISFALATSEDPAPYVKEQGFSWTFAWDKDEAAANAYKAMVVPLTVFIDKNGIISKRVNRKLEKSEFDTELAKIS